MSIRDQIQPAAAVSVFVLVALVSFSATAAELDSVSIPEPHVEAAGDAAKTAAGNPPNADTVKPKSDPSAKPDEASRIPLPEGAHQPAPENHANSEGPILTKRLNPAASPMVAPARRMGWFGIGVRAGTSQMRLAPPTKLITQVNAASGQAPVSGDDMALRANLLNVTPTVHLGGSGYFFKFDIPVAHSQGFDAVGLGVYPINFGWYFDAAALFPYLSVGGTASALIATDSSNSRKVVGGVAQLRGSLGLKYFPARSVGISAELGYSKWTVGAMAGGGGSSGSAITASDSGVAISARGGIGSVVDVSMGVEWL